MGRKWELEKSCRNYLKHIRRGSFETKKTRLRVMLKIIGDLTSIKRLPYSLSKIQPTDIVALVNYWQEKNLKQCTIINRLGVLRSVNLLAQLNIKIPGNMALNLKKIDSEKNNAQIADQFILQKVSHPLTRNILSFQIHFGLTRLEAIQIDPIFITHNNSLMVMKQIAHNHKERSIPILNDIQKSVIEDRRQISSKKITDLMPVKAINHLIQSELLFLGIHQVNDFRSHYVTQRFHIIHNIEGEKVAIKTLMREIGMSKSNHVYKLLDCS